MQYSGRRVRVLGAAILAASLAAATHAGAAKDTKEGCAGKGCKGMMAATVKSVDAKALRIVLTVGEGEEAKELAIRVCPCAKITVDGKKAKLADVKAGVAARVRQVKSKRKGDMVVVCIKVGEGACSGKCGKCAGKAK